MVKLRSSKDKGHPLDRCAATRCQQSEDLEVRAAGVLFEPEIGPVALCKRHLKMREAEMALGPQVEVVRAPGAPHPTAAEVPDGTQALMAAEAMEAEEVLAMIQVFEIVDQESMDFANECLGEVKTKAKEIERIRKTAVQPMNEGLAVVRGWFRPAQDHYKACETAWKNKLAGYARVQAQAQQQALEAVQAAHQGGDVQGVATAMATASQASVELPANVSVRERWVGTIVDRALVPVDYWSPDLTLVQAAVDAGARTIPGVSIERQDVVTRRES